MALDSGMTVAGFTPVIGYHTQKALRTLVEYKSSKMAIWVEKIGESSVAID